MNNNNLSERETQRDLASQVEQGLTVMIDGNYYRRLRVPDDAGLRVCDYCNVDCNCKGRVLETCRKLLSENGYHIGLWLII